VNEFLNDGVIINGTVATYYSSNPAIGSDYKNQVKKGAKKIEFEDDKMYSCSVPVLINRLYRANINEEMLTIATGDPEKARALGALQSSNLRKQYDAEIMEKCTAIAVDKNNYADAS
jgi:hypothetical protein